jgi:hypothetical protein
MNTPKFKHTRPIVIQDLAVIHGLSDYDYVTDSKNKIYMIRDKRQEWIMQWIYDPILLGGFTYIDEK